MGATPAAPASPPIEEPVAVAPSTPAASESPASSRVPSWRKRTVIFAVALLVAAAATVVLARWLRTIPDVQGFLSEFGGSPSVPASTPTGIPPWMGWQHFLNAFFLVLIVRTGLQVRHEKKAPASWTPRARSFFSPASATPKKVSLTQWLHQSLDVLWVANGLVFIVLLLVTGQWMRIVPTHPDVVPHALSAALQYASLDWPTENGWVQYNALQMLAYGITVFIAAPLAVISGVRLSTWWPDKNTRLTRLYPVAVARAVHFPVMLFFVAFTIVHVFLVFFTGALRNLNHMYASRDVVDGWGLGIFLASLAVIAAGWAAARPLFVRPVAAKLGTLSK